MTCKNLTNADKHETILSAELIGDRTCELGRAITQDYRDKDLLVIGVLKGAFIFMADLIRAIDLPLLTDFIQVSSYGKSTESSGTINLIHEPSVDISGRHILLVEDIVDSGLTMKWLMKHFTGKGAASVKVCSLIDKSERREHPVTIDYVGFDIPQGFLIGYGLDLDETFRNLPGVHHYNGE
ncbi:MAG: hypoxanthine phosphoribosyltransferase [Thermodesulfobacteriota bacterium]